MGDRVRSAAELIELGRDREAVAAATREGQGMDGVEQLDQIIPMLGAIVAAIEPAQLSLSTPCAGFDVAGVLEHMIGGASMFAPAFRGESADVAAGDTADGSPQDRFRRAMVDLADAVHAPGAQERTIGAPFGEVPGAVFARYIAFDGLIHGWDLSSATGQPYRPPDTVLREIDTFARDFLKPQLRDGDTFAEATEAPHGSTVLQRLVAFTGRSVALP